MEPAEAKAPAAATIADHSIATSSISRVVSSRSLCSRISLSVLFIAISMSIDADHSVANTETLKHEARVAIVRKLTLVM
jgi:hypothetical protein